MKPIFTLFALFTLTVLSTQAGTTYNITSNKTWSSSGLPSTCPNCTINISTGITLTIDQNVTCQNCTFNGGNITMTSRTLTLQTNSGLSTYFNNVNFTVGGNGTITGSAPIYIAGSIFNFGGNSTFNPQQLLDVSNGSRISFGASSQMISTGGPVNLSGASLLIAGDGSVSSNANIQINGPVLNINGLSGLVVSGPNNYYFNWSQYDGNGHAYITTPNTINCGSGHPHACSSPLVYGPETLTSTGLAAGSALPVVLSNFSATLQNNHTAALAWTTEQESNSAYFSIERSTDGINWSLVGSVNAKGNSAVAMKYNFTDVNPAEGLDQYRLKIVDKDGSYTYSDVKSVKNQVPNKISVFPNPTHDYVNVSVSQSTVNSIKLLNSNGQVLQQVAVNNATKGVVSMPVQKYSAGIYFVQISHTDGSSQSSVLIINGK